MKNTILYLTVFIISLGLSQSKAAANFEASKYVVENGLLFEIGPKGKKEVENAEVNEEERGEKTIYWLTVDPAAGGEEGKIYKGWAKGIYFFNGEGRYIAFLPTPKGQDSYPNFSPDGKLFILDSGKNANREFILYDFEGMAPKKTFIGAPQLMWLSPEAFVFTSRDSQKSPRGPGGDYAGWLSVAVYDLKKDSLTIVAAATPTEDFLLSHADSSSKILDVNKISVKKVADWQNEAAQTQEIIKTPLP
ncbi:MAG: hypothetical protein LBI10_07120 [Deltaproteobacteria bacterium]|jgi:hypothetical protein|nr:hypothetical protein [Deltaproteobacteria bacterium]